jgi:adenosylcobinamide kinase/adenosylcobinamide-phosphate guanylyltransferase
VAWRRILVLGGARSGKSTFAERLAHECGLPIVYVATATAVDEEMAERIAHHRARRPGTWQTVEARTALASHLSKANTVLVEDLTLLLSNHMEDDVATAEAHTLDEVAALLTIEANLVLVSNELGMGLVPESALGRTFRDALGRVNQAAASACDEVYLIVAGLPLRMK